MDKFISLAVLVAVIMLGSVPVAEAASPIKVLTPKVAKVVSKIPAAAVKVGNGVSNWLWTNKGTVAGGTVLTTFVLHPKPFLDTVTAIAGRAVEHGGFGLFAGLAAIIGLIVLYKWGGRLRYFSKWWFGLLLIGMIVLLGGNAQADEIAAAQTVTAPWFSPHWRIVVDVVLIIVMLLPIF